MSTYKRIYTRFPRAEGRATWQKSSKPSAPGPPLTSSKASATPSLPLAPQLMPQRVPPPQRVRREDLTDLDKLIGIQRRLLLTRTQLGLVFAQDRSLSCGRRRSASSCRHAFAAASSSNISNSSSNGNRSNTSQDARILAHRKDANGYTALHYC